MAMGLTDNRTKPEDQWTYYVVDHLPSMANVYRYDTVEEAIEKYKSLPETLKSAIGSSIDGNYEIDHIHRCDGRNVLVMDSTDLYPWQASPVSAEVQESIDKMIAYLNVQHQYCHIFGKMHPSAITDLERYSNPELENYFTDKLLRPEEPKYLLSSVSEVCVESKGWMPLSAFLEHLDNTKPSRPGEGAKHVFVDRLNIEYIDEAGRCGQADISPKNFALLLDKTARETYPAKLSEDLYQFAQDVDPYEGQDQAGNKEEELAVMKKDIASSTLAPYIKFLSEGLSEGYASEDDRKRALSLLSRLTVLTPKEFRKRPLSAMIHRAERKASEQLRNSSRKQAGKER